MIPPPMAGQLRTGLEYGPTINLFNDFLRSFLWKIYRYSNTETTMYARWR